MGNDFRGEHVEGDAHVGKVSVSHWGAKVEILEIAHDTAGIGCRQDAVEEEFGCDQVGCFGADITGVGDSISPHSPADTLGNLFFRTESTDDAQIGGFLVAGDLVYMDEMHGVTANDGTVALGQAVDLSGVGRLPQVALTALAEFMVFSNGTGVRVEGVAVQSKVARCDGRIVVEGEFVDVGVGGNEGGWRNRRRLDGRR